MLPWLLLASLAASCKADAPPSTSEAHGAAVKAAPPVAAPAPEPVPAPAAAADAQVAPAPHEEAPDQAERKAPDPVDPERRLLSAYREVYCLQKKNDQRGVIAVWQQYGYEPETWATDVQAAAQRAQQDPKGFGAKWSAIADEPCP
jgi:hypothetical protein